MEKSRVNACRLNDVAQKAPGASSKKKKKRRNNNHSVFHSFSQRRSHRRSSYNRRPPAQTPRGLTKRPRENSWHGSAVSLKSSATSTFAPNSADPRPVLKKVRLETLCGSPLAVITPAFVGAHAHGRTIKVNVRSRLSAISGITGGSPPPPPTPLSMEPCRMMSAYSVRRSVFRC